MNLSKKAALGVAAVFFSNFALAQTLQDGVANADSHKYAKAKEVFTEMIAKAPTAENYFYLGNAYLTQFEPNFEMAQENFNKGLAADKKSYLNKLGLASVKLGKGDKSAISEIGQIVKDSRDKDAEVLYRAAEALTMNDKFNAPDAAIDYLNKAIERSTKGGVPAYYYYSLGDAYRLKKDPGKAMTAYDNASAVARNKASVFTRMGTLWMAAQQWKLAKDNIDKAIAVDQTYAPAYKAKAAYSIKYQQNDVATNDLLNYAKFADEDPYTQLEIAKLFFINEDYTNAKSVLDKVFDKVDDPIKFKLKSYLSYADGSYAEAKDNMDKFMTSVDKTRILDGDQGLLGLIYAGLAKDEQDAAKKAELLAQSQAKVAVAKNAKDATMKWDEELAKISGAGAASQAKADAGPTNPTIEGLKKKILDNPQDTDSIFQLATEYQNVENWDGAVISWQKMINLLPDWTPAYYSQAYAYQKAGNNEMAKLAYENFIAKTPSGDEAANKETLSFAYYVVAFMEKDINPAKAKSYIAKSVALHPTPDAEKLNKQLNP